MKKTVKVQMDKERTLKFGTKSFITIEKALGTPMAKIDFELMETIYAMLLGGLIHEDKSLTLDAVIDIVDEMVDAKMDNEGKDFQNAFMETMQYLGESVGEIMNPQGTEALPTK